MDFSESTQQIEHNGKSFSVKIIAAGQPTCVGVFAAGRGGSPLRYLSLLRAVAGQGCTIVAPHFDMLPLAAATKEELDARIEQLEIVLNRYSISGKPLVGIGHSIGGTLLLTLAGGKALTLSGHRIMPRSKWKFDGLALLAPSVDFFLYPGALEDVDTQIYLRTGIKDTITPPAKTLLLSKILERQIKLKFVLDEEAGHFSYMDELPPKIEDPQPNRDTFLSDLAENIAQFVTSAC